MRFILISTHEEALRQLQVIPQSPDPETPADPSWSLKEEGVTAKKKSRKRASDIDDQRAAQIKREPAAKRRKSKYKVTVTVDLTNDSDEDQVVFVE